MTNATENVIHTSPVFEVWRVQLNGFEQLAGNLLRKLALVIWWNKKSECQANESKHDENMTNTSAEVKPHKFNEMAEKNITFYNM
jgi:hypothetical protein